MNAIRTVPVLLLLAACGGGGGSDAPHVPTEPPPAPVQETTGLGDHGKHQRPSRSDSLGNEVQSVRNGAQLRAGTWRDPQGRDGSRSGETLAGYFNSMDRLVSFLAPTGPVTVRVHGATSAEMAIVRGVVAEMNRALPRSHRISVAAGTASVLDYGAVTDGEIDLYMTSGKADWPAGLIAEHPGAAGVGGVVSNPSINGGPFSWKAGTGHRGPQRGRDEQGRSSPTRSSTPTASSGHVDSSQFPSSLMGSYAGRSAASAVSTSIDGEALLALVRMMRTLPRPGSEFLAGQITVSDFGPWSDTGFHVTGTAGEVQFGASWRNGLAKTWVHGDEPSGHVRTSVTGTATWEGALAGFTDAGHTVTGDAAITVDVAAMSGSAAFDGDRNLGVQEGHPGTPGNRNRLGRRRPGATRSAISSLTDSASPRPAGTPAASKACSWAPATKVWAGRSSAATSAPPSGRSR